DEPRRDAASNARLDHPRRAQMVRQTPDGAHERWIAIPPPAEGTTSELDAFPFVRAHHPRPQLPEVVSDGAGPGRACEFVEHLLPVLVDFVRAWRPWHESRARRLRAHRPALLALRDPRVEADEALDGVAKYRAGRSPQTPYLGRSFWPSVKHLPASACTASGNSPSLHPKCGERRGENKMAPDDEQIQRLFDEPARSRPTSLGTYELRPRPDLLALCRMVSPVDGGWCG